MGITGVTVVPDTLLTPKYWPSLIRYLLSVR